LTTSLRETLRLERQVYQPADTEVAARQGELDWVGRLRRALHERRFCLYAQENIVVSTARKP
jgi:hypothetical protein